MSGYGSFVLFSVVLMPSPGPDLLRVEPLFEAVRWTGVAYLLWLAFQSLRSAVRGRYADPESGSPAGGTALRGLRLGFTSNITNSRC